MHVFVINLKRRPDRLAEMEKELQRIGLPFERIDAFDASSESFAGRVSWAKTYFHNYMMMPSKGSLGCFFSHQRAWQQIVDRNIGQALILEDDTIADDWDHRIADINLDALGIDQLRIEQYIPKDQPRLRPLPIQPYHQTKLLGRTVLSQNSLASGAYICTRRGAEKMLKCRKYWFFIDYYHNWAELYDVRTALLLPTMWRQKLDDSDVSVPQQVRPRPAWKKQFALLARRALLAYLFARKRLSFAP